jgi:hypothetical protein
MAMTTHPTLDQAIADDALWLESGFLADRWQVGTDEFGDGISDWFCRDCGAGGADPIEGCSACGFGQHLETDEEMSA